MINTLLIQPNIPHSNTGTISPWDMPPLGIAYIAAVLEKNNFPVKIIDAYIQQLSLNQLKDEINKSTPQIIGITANIFSARFAIITAKYIKLHFPHILIVMGGPFPTVNYENILSQKVCNITVLGEGEYVFLDLVKKINEKQSWSQIRGIAFLENYKIIVNPRTNFIENLDELPFPAWHLFPSFKKYRNLRGVTYRPYLPLITSRGCPYNCNWCTKNVHGYTYRPRSPENIVKEMVEHVKNYAIKEFAIVDDNFTLDPIRVKKLCVLIKKAGLNIILNFYSGIRADTISESLLKYLIAVGINRITVGVESGNQSIVYKIGKSLNLHSVTESVRLAKKYHLISDGFFMIGHPFDSLKTIDETIKYAIKTDFTHAYFFIVIPFPGTPLYDIIREKGKFFIDYSSGIPSHIVEGKPLFEVPGLSANKVEEKFKESYKRFYLRPRKVISLGLTYIRYICQYRTMEIVRWIMSQFISLIFFSKPNKPRK